MGARLTGTSGAAFVAPEPLKRATIICDASWCPNTKSGGWAVWITTSIGYDANRKRIKRSGVFHEKPRGAEEAERWACYNGLWLAAQEGVKRALIQTDCLNVVQRRGPDWDQVTKFLGEMEIRWKHVKGHTDNPESRFYVNRWCDREAKRRMRIQRRKSR